MTVPQFESAHIQKRAHMHANDGNPPSHSPTSPQPSPSSPGPPPQYEKTNTQSSVQLIEEEPCSLFVHATRSVENAVLSLLGPLSVFCLDPAAPAALSTIFNGVCAHKEMTMPPVI